ncbi:MAG: hypothetical protein KatS3mg045_1341 [Bellilinea sp.]|nr:MAG: hypothetical protein KatS3mg045_1341 [Bellilinea sp.]
MEGHWIEEIVNRAVQVVFQRLIASAPRRNILMVFTGAGSGYAIARDAIRLLVEGGHSLKVILSSAAGYLIGAENLRKAGAQEIIQAGEWVWTPTLIQECDLILVPTLSINTAAKLAAGMMDSLPNTILLGGLLAGKPVIAIADGADPFGDGGKVFGEDTGTAPLLRARFTENLSVLRSFGFQLVHKEQFLAAVLSGLINTHPVVDGHSAAPGKVLQPAESATLSSSWITAAELSRFRRGQIIHIPHGAHLTPLARETARQLELVLTEG